MKRETVWMFACLLITSLPRGHPDMTCYASVGETVVLPCTSTSPEELNISHSRLYWQKEDHVVHFFQEGHDDLKSQDKQYHGRTSLFLNKVKHGNFSLKLSNVQLQDEAVYSCIYSQPGHQTQKSKIKLSVSDRWQPKVQVPDDKMVANYLFLGLEGLDLIARPDSYHENIISLS